MAWERGGHSRTSTAAHRRWARQVKARDGYRCQRCGYQGSATAQPHDIEANHIVNSRSGGTDTLSNGEALCLPCHAAQRTAASDQLSPTRADADVTSAPPLRPAP